MTPFESDLRAYRDLFQLLSMPMLLVGYAALFLLWREGETRRRTLGLALAGWTVAMLSAMTLTGYFGPVR